MDEVIYIRIPKELREKAIKHGINISKLLIEALRKEIEKRELEEIKSKLEKKKKLLKDLASVATELQRISREEN